MKTPIPRGVHSPEVHIYHHHLLQEVAEILAGLNLKVHVC